jgi:DNA-binding response OmpR family regulator
MHVGKLGDMKLSSPVNVLLVEDHIAVAEATAELLREFGCRVVTCAPTLREARDAASSKTPDLAIIDRHLPDGDGAGLIAELRARGVRCAMLTADPRPEDEDGSLDGIEWVEKPLTPARLESLVGRLA